MFNKAFDLLKNMKHDEEKALQKEHPSYENFVNIVKFIIDNAEDWNNGFSITFNSDYSKIRKHDRINFSKHKPIKT